MGRLATELRALPAPEKTPASFMNSRMVRSIGRGFLALAWLNGLRFWLSLVALGVVLLAVGSATARVIGAVLLVACFVGVVAVVRR